MRSNAVWKGLAMGMQTYVRALTLAVCSCLVSSLAFAQHKPAYHEGASDPQVGPSREAEEAEAKQKADDEESKNPMNWLGLGVKVGAGRVLSGSIKNPTYQQQLADAASHLTDAQKAMYGLSGHGCTPIDHRCGTPGRFGTYVALTLALGGDGLGLDIEPYMNINSDVQAYGAYAGLKFDFHLLSRLYIGVGAGLKGARLVTKGWDHGADLYGRIPLRGTLYFSKHMALVAEFAFGAGATGYESKAITVTNPANGVAIKTSPSLTFGTGRSWDMSVGIRFP
jgi:hypothetical protein